MDEILYCGSLDIITSLGGAKSQWMDFDVDPGASMQLCLKIDNLVFSLCMCENMPSVPAAQGFTFILGPQLYVLIINQEATNVPN